MIGEALPLWVRQWIPYLALGHGIFNLLIFGLFIRQGWLGLVIRRTRLRGAPLPIAVIRRHRQAGPLAATLGGIGFLAGILLTLLDKGRVAEYPAHFAVGSLIVLVIFVLYASSRRITGVDAPYRTPHADLGLLLLALYVVQAVLGLGILL